MSGGGRQRKGAVFELLNQDDLNPALFLEALAAIPAHEAVNALFPALCRTEEALRWRAVSGMGASVARLADADMEAARVVMRRFLWSLNDESGGIGWGAPEAMAEAMCRHAGLAEEYAHMLLSYMREDGPELLQDGNFLEHPLLQRGLLWGVARLAGVRPELLRQRGAGPEIPPFLAHKDAAIRACACMICGHLGVAAAAEDLARLAMAPAEAASVTLYDVGGGGFFMQTSVAATARAALERLEQANHAD